MRLLDPRVGDVWKRDEGKERVQILRVWQADGTWCITVQPKHGGPWYWTTVPEFKKRFSILESVTG